MNWPRYAWNSACRHRRVVIVYLGLLADYQGTDLLLSAMKRVRADQDDVYLLLMGFPNVAHYQQMAAELQISDRVVFTGRVLYEEAPLYLALGDIAVAPKLSLTESAGKLLNYMAVGLPTIAFDTPVAREYLGNNGMFAERGSAESLADHILEVLAHPDLGRSIGQRLRQRAVEQFEWRQSAHIILDAYAELTGRDQNVYIVQQERVPTAD